MTRRRAADSAPSPALAILGGEWHIRRQPIARTGIVADRPALDEALAATVNSARLEGASSPGAVAIEVATDALAPSRYQPRRHFPDEGVLELAASIRAQGVLQPLIVRAAHESAAARYEIVAGERRWRAAKLAGLEKVPVIVRELDDQSALAVALIENVQREDLNPIDQAHSLARLAEEYALTHEQVGQALGRSRAWVSNLLRLLDLNDEVKALLVTGGIDMGHARALLPLDAERQAALARRAERLRLSVRQVEKAVSNLLKASGDGDGTAAAIDLQTVWLQRQIAREVGRSVAIQPQKDGTYALKIGFGNLGELQDALERLQALVGQIRDTAGPRARDAG